MAKVDELVSVIQSDKSEEKKQILYISTYKWNLRSGTNAPTFQGRSGDADEEEACGRSGGRKVGRTGKVALTYKHAHT